LLHPHPSSLFLVLSTLCFFEFLYHLQPIFSLKRPKLKRRYGQLASYICKIVKKIKNKKNLKQGLLLAGCMKASKGGGRME
jgi:hypothetical protein